MARNKEKQFGKLNRLFLEKEKEEFLKRYPKRPHLSTLTSADAIQQWLPSIKRDIDYHLKQAEVVCYSSDKIEEHHSEVDRLESEYKRFVRKMKQLDDCMDDIPWTERPYKSKKIKTLEKVDAESNSSQPSVRISTPITSSCSSVTLSVEDYRTEGDDQPLVFQDLSKEINNDKSKERINEYKFSNEAAVQNTELKLKKIFGLV